MAISVFFKKSDESSRQVTYEVIGDPAEQPLSLTIDKAAELLPQEAFKTRLQSTAYRMIMTHHAKTGAWIDHGHRQS